MPNSDGSLTFDNDDSESGASSQEGLQHKRRAGTSKKGLEFTAVNDYGVEYSACLDLKGILPSIDDRCWSEPNVGCRPRIMRLITGENVYMADDETRTRDSLKRVSKVTAGAGIKPQEHLCVPSIIKSGALGKAEVARLVPTIPPSTSTTSTSSPTTATTTSSYSSTSTTTTTPTSSLEGPLETQRQSIGYHGPVVPGSAARFPGFDTDFNSGGNGNPIGRPGSGAAMRAFGGDGGAGLLSGAGAGQQPAPAAAPPTPAAQQTSLTPYFATAGVLGLLLMLGLGAASLTKRRRRRGSRGNDSDVLAYRYSPRRSQ